jgi:putative transcriptional regulator
VKAKKYQSRIAETVHKTAAGLHGIGAIDKTTMREFDVMCLTMVEELSAREIQKIRKRAGVSQEVFSRYLNVPVTLVPMGEKKPSGPSLKLLSLVKLKGLEAIA